MGRRGSRSARPRLPWRAGGGTGAGSALSPPMNIEVSPWTCGSGGRGRTSVGRGCGGCGRGPPGRRVLRRAGTGPGPVVRGLLSARSAFPLLLPVWLIGRWGSAVVHGPDAGHAAGRSSGTRGTGRCTSHGSCGAVASGGSRGTSRRRARAAARRRRAVPFWPRTRVPGRCAASRPAAPDGRAWPAPAWPGAAEVAGALSRPRTPSCASLSHGRASRAGTAPWRSWISASQRRTTISLTSWTGPSQISWRRPPACPGRVCPAVRPGCPSVAGRTRTSHPPPGCHPNRAATFERTTSQAADERSMSSVPRSACRVGAASAASAAHVALPLSTS